MQREHLGSRLGFILLSAGCAIGIGNVWKFPYIAGQNGGAIFVLIYAACLILLGLPVMTMEFSLGRASGKSPAKLYDELEPKNSKWHFHGYASVVGNYLLMMFYTVVSGWMLKYFVATAKGDFKGAQAERDKADKIMDNAKAEMKEIDEKVQQSHDKVSQKMDGLQRQMY